MFTLYLSSAHYFLQSAHRLICSGRDCSILQKKAGWGSRMCGDLAVLLFYTSVIWDIYNLLLSRLID